MNRAYLMGMSALAGDDAESSPSASSISETETPPGIAMPLLTEDSGSSATDSSPYKPYTPTAPLLSAGKLSMADDVMPYTAPTPDKYNLSPGQLSMSPEFAPYVAPTPSGSPLSPGQLSMAPQNMPTTLAPQQMAMQYAPMSLQTAPSGGGRGLSWGGAAGGLASGLADIFNKPADPNAAASAAAAASDKATQDQIDKINRTQAAQSALAQKMAAIHPSAANMRKLNLANQRLADVKKKAAAFNAAHPPEVVPQKKPEGMSKPMMIGLALAGVGVVGGLGYFGYKKWGRK